MWNKKRRDILDLTHKRGKASTEIAARSLRKIKEIAVKVRERIRRSRRILVVWC